MSPTGMMSISLRLAMYVSAAEWFSSLNNSGVKPATPCEQINAVQWALAIVFPFSILRDCRRACAEVFAQFFNAQSLSTMARRVGQRQSVSLKSF
ncbi:MAG: hypothetical protein COC21_04240 [Verrucomicrobiales bacterium]|nr:MAG: hypothetical protein COC21_04240 [Verrucomicrobiales bacterium]